MFDFKKIVSNKTVQILVIITAVLLAALTVTVCIQKSRISSVFFEAVTTANDDDSYTRANLTAKDANARRGSIKDNGTARFGFSQAQKDCFLKVYRQYRSAALVVRVQFTPNADQKELLTTGTALPFNLGLLYSEDFDSKNRLKEPLSSKITVYADLSKKLSYNDSEPLVIDFSLAVPKSEHFEAFLPQEFFISSSVQCKVLSVCTAPALIGFDCTSTPVFYGFASNGGVVNFLNNSVDFSGGTLVFPVQNAGGAYMPQITVSFIPDEELKNKTARLTIGGEKLYVRNAFNVNSLELPAASLKNPFAVAELGENRECVNALIMKASNLYDLQTDEEDRPYRGIKTDPGLILAYNKKNWRNEAYEVFEWDRYEHILFFDTADYDIQNNFFRRLAYFVEKAGYRGSLWPDEVLEGKHGYNAHDYSAESLASFFNKATEENFKLNPEEETLKKILLVNGLLVPDGNLVKSGGGGLVSISQQSDAFTRAKLLAHEAWHTLFFRDEAFRNFVAAVFYTFEPDSRQFLLDFFASQPGLGYDLDDEYLVHNEFMAYIMQQRLADVSEYFVGRANLYSVRVFTPDLARYVRETNAKGFEDAAVILNDYTYDTYGIKGGNVALVNR